MAVGNNASGLESTSMLYSNYSLTDNLTDVNATEGFIPYWETPDYVYINMFIYGLGTCMWVGTIGNILSLLTLQRKVLRSRSTSIYLSSLAVSDILNLWVMNQTEWFNMVIGRPIIRMPCGLEKLQIAVYTMWSSWIITAVTVERYIAVCHPLKAALWNTSRRALIIVVTIPLFLILLNFYVYFSFTMTEIGCDSAPGWEEVTYNLISKWIIFLRAIIPGAILFGLNIAIIKRLRSTSKSISKIKGGNGDDPKTHVSSSREADIRKITFLVLTVSIAHIVLTIPVSGFGLYIDVVSFEEFGSYTLVYVFVLTEILSLANHSINFLLYILSSKQFRTEFLRMITCEKYKGLSRQGSTRVKNTARSSIRGSEKQKSRPTQPPQ